METNLSSGYYVDGEVFCRERQSVFSRSWQLLGPVSRLEQAGQYISADIAGMKVFAIRGRDGSLRAFRNVCRHRGAQLLEAGEGSCRLVRCPYHNWSYADSGELKSAPWFGEDPDFDLADWPLQSIGVDHWRGLVFVSVDPEMTLSVQLGETAAELDDVALETFLNTDCATLEFDANWKIYTDNFVEGYHIPGIHPAFFEAIEFEQFETVALDGMVKMTAPTKAGLFYQGRWYWMWPNWTLSLFEGGMSTSRINPVSENRTELHYRFYFDAEHRQDEEFRNSTINRNLAVIREDFSICLETHNNYRSGGYESGPLSPRHERGVAYFQSRYQTALSS